MTSLATSLDLSASLKRFVLKEAAEIPFPASGQTHVRFDRLSSVGRLDLSLARLIEGHLDAVAILEEASMSPSRAGDTYGVWAARCASEPTRAKPCTGGWELHGNKSFCSGASFLDRALVTAEASDGYRLFDVDLRVLERRIEPGSWQAVGMAASDSQSFNFDATFVPRERCVGGPGFYLDRPGFWFGASGVAACWFGGADGLLEVVARTSSASVPERTLVELGRAYARVETMRSLLAAEAAEIDLDPTDVKGGARRRALSLRQLVHDLSLEVLSLTAEAGGARPLCKDGGQARRAADLFVYLAQHHGDRDAAELGRILVSDYRWPS